MSIWKDLLFLGGHVATPSALEALRDAAPAPAAAAACGAPATQAGARDATTCAVAATPAR